MQLLTKNYLRVKYSKQNLWYRIKFQFRGKIDIYSSLELIWGILFSMLDPPSCELLLG